MANEQFGETQGSIDSTRSHVAGSHAAEALGRAHKVSRKTSSYAQRFTLRLLLGMRFLKKYQARLSVQVNAGPFHCRSAENTDDIKAIIRFRVETQSLSVKNRNFIMDELDLDSDHLMIFHTATKELVGTVRIRSTFWGQQSTNCRNFYLNNLLVLAGEKLELSRLRFRKEYHRPVVTGLLWRALADVMIATKSQYIFGSVSLPLTNPRQVALLYHFLSEEGRFHQNAFCPPQRPHSMENLDLWIMSIKNPLTALQKLEAKSLLSPLFQNYLQAGAAFGGEPAWDGEARCTDFLTILHRDDLNRAIWRRFDLKTESSIA